MTQDQEGEHIAGRVLVVDAANVVGARADGWWKDRAGAAERLLAGLARLAADGALERAWPAGAAGHVGGRGDTAVPSRGDEQVGGQDGKRDDGQDAGQDAGRHVDVVVVLEGRATAATSDPPGVTVVRTSRSGDDAVVEAVAARAGADLLVTTSDRELRRRVEDFGASVRGAGWLRDLLDGDRAGG